MNKSAADHITRPCTAQLEALKGVYGCMQPESSSLSTSMCVRHECPASPDRLTELNVKAVAGAGSKCSQLFDGEVR